MSKDEHIEIAGIALSSPQKPMFAEAGLTKLDVARHFQRVSDRMLPLVKKRLISLLRCPDGVERQCFFQRHGAKGFPGAIKRMEIEEKDGGREDYLHIEDLAGLIAAVQMGSLEFHIWGSRIDKLEKPDRLVFDLDPDEELDFTDVRAAAFDVRDRLEAAGLKSLPLLTGGKGVHVVVPMEARTEWPAVKTFAKGFADALAKAEPKRFVAEASKVKRTGRIFIDWLRNERSATAIAPYSIRARAGAPVATPVSWEELPQIEAANAFHMEDMEQRLAARDPWIEAGRWRQSVRPNMLSAVSG